MRTDADQGRRNARYPAYGSADRKTAGPRSIACDAARQTDGKLRHNGSSAAFVQPNHTAQSAEDCTAHRNSTPERAIAAQRMDSCIIVFLKMNDDVEKSVQEQPIKMAG